MTIVLSGLAVAAIYALVAIGFNIVFVATSAFNFAQAQFVMLGTLFAWSATVSMGWPLLLTVAGGVVIGAALGVVQYFVTLEPVLGRGTHAELVTTVGMSVLVGGIAIQIWGSDPHRVPPVFSSRVIDVLGGRITIDELALVLITVAVLLGAWFWSQHSRWGLASLATSEDRDAARLRGVNVRALAAVTTGIAGALIMALGPLIATKTLAYASLGDTLVLKGFLVLALGGFGSYRGILVGSAMAGIGEAMVARYLGGDYVNIFLFLLLLAVLCLRPQGIFGVRTERAV